ncbi:MAG: porin [Polyangiales bacterium]
MSSIARAVLALALFAPAVARADESSLPIVGYDPDRGAFIRTPDGAWELNPYAMVQLTQVNTWHGAPADTSGFNVRAAKLIFHGHVLVPELTYHYQINAGEGRVVAEDVYLRWDPLPWFGLLVGQNEVPYNRQHITLEAYQELVERSSVDARFNLQRDIGLTAYLSALDHRLEATLGVYNGARQNSPNDDTTYMTTARLAFNPWGPIAFREADLDYSLHPKLSLAFAVAHNPQRIVPGEKSNTTLLSITQAVVESTLRFRGLSLTTEGHARRQTPEGHATQRDYGAFTQVGYFVMPHHLEIIGRYGAIGGVTSATDVTREETVGVSLYLRGHRFKLQVDGSRLETLGAGVGLRTRAQLEFFL